MPTWRVEDVKVNESCGPCVDGKVGTVPGPADSIISLPQWTWPLILTQPPATSSCLRTFDVSNVGVSDRRAVSTLRDSTMTLESWAPFASPLGPLRGGGRGERQGGVCGPLQGVRSRVRRDCRLPGIRIPDCELHGPGPVRRQHRALDVAHGRTPFAPRGHFPGHGYGDPLLL